MGFMSISYVLHDEGKYLFVNILLIETDVDKFSVTPM